MCWFVVCGVGVCCSVCNVVVLWGIGCVLFGVARWCCVVCDVVLSVCGVACVCCCVCVVLFSV